MNAHWRYLKYVLRHKWFVYQAGRKTGVSRWQLLCHDLSKFRPDEWQPYAFYFYGEPFPDAKWYGDFCNWEPWEHTESGSKHAFNVAWLKHLHRNPHHWQHWVLRNDDGTTHALRMPLRYCREMVADWIGAGRAIHGKNEVREWYAKNANKMILHPDTRARVEMLIKEA